MKVKKIKRVVPLKNYKSFYQGIIITLILGGSHFPGNLQGKKKKFDSLAHFC